MKITAIAIALTLTSGAAFAETGVQYRPVLELAANLCPSVKQQTIDWARGNNTIGSFALPTLRNNPSASCDEAIAARSGYSFGYSNQTQADAVALQICTEQNAGNDAVGGCVVVGRLRPGPV